MHSNIQDDIGTTSGGAKEEVKRGKIWNLVEGVQWYKSASIA